MPFGRHCPGESLKLRQGCAFRKRIVERLGESLKACKSDGLTALGRACRDGSSARQKLEVKKLRIEGIPALMKHAFKTLERTGEICRV